MLLGPGAEELADALGVDLLGVLEAERATGKTGEVTTYPVPLGIPDNPALRLVLLVGVGDQAPRDLRRAGAALARAVRDRSSVATSVAAAGGDEGLTTFVVGMTLGSFGFHLRSQGPEHTPVGRVVLAATADDEAADAALHRGIALGGAGWRARMLSTVPSNIKNPQWLAEQAEELAGGVRARGHRLGREAAGQGGLRRHPRRRPGLRDPAAADPARLRARARAARRRSWCWSARASPSTPAVCRSSPARAWPT